MQPTYADILMLSTAHGRAERSDPMPLLGFLTGFSLALVLWSAIGWMVWALLG